MFTMSNSPGYRRSHSSSLRSNAMTGTTDPDGWNVPSPRSLVTGIAAKIEVPPASFGDGQRLWLVHLDPPPF
jgi:hypothetical protein